MPLPPASALVVFGSIFMLVGASVNDLDLPNAGDNQTDIFSVDNCNGACIKGDGTFCGSDGQCHPIQCADWYRFGPQNFTTGRYTDQGESGDTTLSCQDITPTIPGSKEVFYSGVSFRCRSLKPPGIELGFTRKCTAKPSSTSEFTCYELAESTDFGGFLTRVNDTGLNCTDNKYNETGYPQFTYHFIREYRIESFGSTIVSPGFNGTSMFDPTRATNGTMYSIFTEPNSPTAAPTAPPTKSMNTLPPSSAALFAAKNWLSISVAFLLSGIYTFV